MGERIARIKIQREPGAMYYVKADDQGWLCIYKTELKRGGGAKKKDDKSLQSNQERTQTEQAL